MLPFGILVAVIELAAIFPSVTFKSTIDAVTTAPDANLSAVTWSSAIFKVFTELVAS